MTLFDGNKHNDSNAVGEDTWDLFESVERSFRIDLGDFYSLAGIRVSELAENICKLADYPPNEKCLSTVVFYKLRKAFGDLFDIPSRSVRPNTPLRRLLPWRSREKKWRAMQEHLEIDLPGLVFPRSLLLFCLITPVTLLICGKEFLGLRLGWAGLIFFSFLFVLLTVFACTPFARSLPLDCETVGDLAKAVLAKNYAVFATHHGGSAGDDVLSSLRLLIASETCMQLSDVLPETQIPADLNIY
jgi:hypothetical protein